MNLKEYGIDIKKGKIELHKSSFTGREWRVLQRIFGTTPDCVAIKVEGNLKISKIDKVGFQNNYKQILEQDPAEKTFDLNVIKSFIMSKGGSINIDELEAKAEEQLNVLKKLITRAFWIWSAKERQRSVMG